jgi:uncharacterized protein (TIGR02145 family)
VKVNYTDTNGCDALSPAQFDLSVYPGTSVTTSPLNKSICSGDSTRIILAGSQPGTTFSWTATSNSIFITGYSNGSGLYINQKLINTGSNPDSVIYLVTPDYGGCLGLTVDYVVTVNPLLPVSITVSPSENPVCEGTSVTFTASSTNGGTNPTYQWKVNGANVGTNQPTYSYVPSNGDSVRCVLTSSEQCPSGNPASSNPVIMGVKDAPVVIFTPCFDTITTTTAKPIKLKGGIPLGGTYTGPGVSNGYFYPGIAGSGTKTITYTYVNSALCSASAQSLIHSYTQTLLPCGEPMTDIRDGKTYPTVQIGTQCWMAANLNFGTMIPGGMHQRDNCISEKYCFNDDPALCALHSALYQWDELMRYEESEGVQGLCPPGWHIPTEAEWNVLFSNWTNNAFAGAPLKYSGYSGFNALLSGVNHLNRQWDFQDFATFFWSSTAHGTNKAWAHGMNDCDASVSAYSSYRNNAFSVRCVKD